MIAVVIIIVALLLLLIVGFIAIFNGLVSKRNRVDNAWHQIDVQLKRRFDLIPNLVETVKGYAAHEKEVFEKVTQARAMVTQAGSVGQRAQAEGMITEALKTLFAVAENYPDLKANQNVSQLQEELASTENKIAFSRQFYNDSVMRYNTACETVPTNIIAGMFAFQKAEFFEVKDEAERAAPKVNLSLK